MTDPTFFQASPEAEAAINASSLEASPQVRKRPFLSHGAITLAALVGGLSNVCIKQLLLPIQIAQIAPQTTATSFFFVASTGAVVGMIAAPLSGALSDRTTLRFGKRRLWCLIGVLVATLGMLLMAGATTLFPLLLGEICAQIGVDTLLAAVTALIPDQIQERHRGLLSALVGMAPNVGGVIGLLLVIHFTDVRHISQGYLFMALVSLACIGIFLLLVREKSPASPETWASFQLGLFLSGFLSPLRTRDFCFTFVSRCFAYLSFTILGAFTLFYLQAILHLPVAAAASHLTLFQVVSTSVLLLTSVLTGLVARRWERLKPFVIAGALVMAASLLLMAVFPTWWAVMATAILFGLGFGLYLGVDVALAVAVLPTTVDHGKDLGLMYTAIFLALTISPAIGAMVLNLFQSYPFLFVCASISSLMAALFIVPITSVR